MRAAVGDALPPLERTLDLVDLVAYAGATWDWHRLHYDADFVNERGLPGPLVDGQMFGALLAKQALDWAGPQAQLRSMSFRFKATVFAGETVRCESEVAAVEEIGSGRRLTLTQGVVTGEGRVVIEKATLVLSLTS